MPIIDTLRALVQRGRGDAVRSGGAVGGGGTPPTAAPPAAASQLRVQPPDAYASGNDAAAYRALRHSVPIIDAAVQKLIRLAGGVEVTLELPPDSGGGNSGVTGCTRPRASAQSAEALTAELAEFLRTVPTGRSQRGLSSFLDSYIDSLLVTGRAVGEMVCTPDGLSALLCVDVAKVIPVEGTSPLDFRLDAIDPSGRRYTPPRQELLLFTTHQPEPTSPYGVSILRSLGQCSDVLLKIFRTIGSNWERLGNPRFILSCKSADDSDSCSAQERAEQLAVEWEKAMSASRGGETRDFVTVGDIEAKVIGADGQLMDAQSPARLLTEQIVAKTGVPPFMLGLSWSTTERMSAQQADILTSELDAIRRIVTPVVEAIVETWLRLKGLEGYGIGVNWITVNMQDEVELARARLYNAQADKYVVAE